ncbi:MAG: hypothetical protein LW854_21565 [Rubrivivax sp.]|jgi:hypothetical protein|nr:hypothetical protein [Rubrivivax sp.]
MNITDWKQLPPDQFLDKLRDAQMTPEQYEQTVAAIEADRRMVADMEARGTLPTKLPEGKLGDSLSYGMPSLED